MGIEQKLPLVVVETERLRIRELCADSDLEFILELFNEPEFVRFVGDRGLRVIADSRRYIEEQAASYTKNGFGLWGVELKESGEQVGICGLLRRPALTNVEIGFGFLERFCGRGIASEAAEAVMRVGRDRFHLKRIVAVTAPDNHGSIQILQKLGLRFEKLVDLPGFSVQRKLFSPPL